MRRRLVYCTILAAALCGFLCLSDWHSSGAATAVEPQLAHDVYFSLKDNSAEAKHKMVAACKKYLSKHPGEAFFAAGTRAEDLNRDINDRDFDVALHIVFRSKLDHDQYQDAARHKEFISQNQGNWKKVRVFDSLVER
jgi:hypothetical protein